MKQVFTGFVVAILMLANTGLAEATDEAIGRIKIVRGSADVIMDGTTVAATVGMELKQGMVLKTGDRGRMGLTFVDSSRFALGPNSEVAVENFRFNSTTYDGKFQAAIKKGTLAVVSGKIAKGGQDAMTVKTPTSVLGVRGTNFLIKIDE